jgi:hypothetical protein
VRPTHKQLHPEQKTPQTKRTTMRNTEESDKEVYKVDDHHFGEAHEIKQLTVQQLARNPQLSQKDIEKMEPDEIRALCVQVRVIFK